MRLTVMPITLSPLGTGVLVNFPPAASIIVGQDFERGPLSRAGPDIHQLDRNWIGRKGLLLEHGGQMARNAVIKICDLHVAPPDLLVGSG